jgi:hypothetical protein
MIALTFTQWGGVVILCWVTLAVVGGALSDIREWF